MSIDKRGTGALHGHRGAFALALLARRGARAGLAGIIIGLAVGAAFADRERARRPGFGDESRCGEHQCQRKNEQRAALRSGVETIKIPSPEAKSAQI